MRIQKSPGTKASAIELVGDDGEPIDSAVSFVRFLTARGCSPHTIAANLYDLKHFFQFLRSSKLTVTTFRRARATEFLGYLAGLKPNSNRRPITFPHLVGQLSPTTINRKLAAVSTFYEHLVLTAADGIAQNPLGTAEGGRQPVRRRYVRDSLRLKRINRLPRPLADDQTTTLLNRMTRPRDRAIVPLMLQGGLRPCEVLNLHLEDSEVDRHQRIQRRIDQLLSELGLPPDAARPDRRQASHDKQEICAAWPAG